VKFLAIVERFKQVQPRHLCADEQSLHPSSALGQRQNFRRLGAGGLALPG